MNTIRLTTAQALVRFLLAQRTEIDGETTAMFAGVWAIFGHGNVAGLGEALYAVRDVLPTYRAHNEQGMAHAAIAFAKASNRRRLMACTTSIGPGATNLVTAAALAHVSRLPVLLLPGDVFANRAPDPVLQQVEAFHDGTLSANDCLRPVSRYFDRIIRPEQLMSALPKAMGVFTDPAACGPVTLALCQDVQAQSYDYPTAFFNECLRMPRRPGADPAELAAAVKALRAARAPLVIAGGGAHYAQATQTLRHFAERYGLPVAETQAGKSALPDEHALNVGGIGVSGSSTANTLARNADVILAIGTRLQDFTTGSRSLFAHPGARLIMLNVQPFDAIKQHALPLVADARSGIDALEQALGDWPGTSSCQRAHIASLNADWEIQADAARAPDDARRPSDAQVIGAIQAAGKPGDIVVCAAGGLPGELHKLWRADTPGSYHVEYGYSCMGYEIAGGLGVKMARPEAEVIVMVGDGAYLMLNSEIATSILLGRKLIIVVLNNGGFGCINRLQQSTGGVPFNNLFESTAHSELPEIDFAKHAQSLGAIAEHVTGVPELGDALARARDNPRTSVMVIETDADLTTAAGGCWWDVAVAQDSTLQSVRDARKDYERQRSLRDTGAAT